MARRSADARSASQAGRACFTDSLQAGCSSGLGRPQTCCYSPAAVSTAGRRSLIAQRRRSAFRTFPITIKRTRVTPPLAVRMGGCNEYANPAHTDQSFSRSRAACRRFAGAKTRAWCVIPTRHEFPCAAATVRSRNPGHTCPTCLDQPRRSNSTDEAMRPWRCVPTADSCAQSRNERCGADPAHRSLANCSRSTESAGAPAHRIQT